MRLQLPKRMTHIWVGPKRQPIEWMRTWQALHPDWEYNVITDSDFWGREWVLKDQMLEYYRRGFFNGVADLIRYETLYADGGFLPPADAICLHSVDELLCSPPEYCYTVYESEEHKPHYVSPILACAPDNEFVRELILALKKKEPKKLTDAVWAETGNAFVAKMILRLEPDITIWPSHYFIPQHYSSDRRYSGPDKVYADQLWGTTKGIYS